jgi:hypothetical protein
MVETFMRQYARGDSPNPVYTPAVANRLRTTSFDADFITDSQDFEVKNVRVTVVHSSTDWEVIEARFTNFGEPRVVRFDYRAVRFVAGASDTQWGIANVTRGTFDLRRRLGLEPLPAW